METSGVFVGRARELGQLERALAATLAGSGATVQAQRDERGLGQVRYRRPLRSTARL